MKFFAEWLKERNDKVVAFRRWLWNRTYENGTSPSPVSNGDPDYEWVADRANRLGPLDPHKHEHLSGGTGV